ncbi:hypothetical protein SANA_07580 [Gottschalkiaceae bacterium SANA]|nr:hypothetical protein SANA_07580 [Gottschalkiaceae bacterium SANA]
MIVNIFWGSLMIAAGLFLLICASVKSEFVVYRILAARSKIIWGEKVYRFHQVSGGLIVIFGILMILGIIGK